MSGGGTQQYIIYQDGENICAYNPFSGNAETDIISLATKSLKEIANDKGWTVIEA